MHVATHKQNLRRMLQTQDGRKTAEHFTDEEKPSDLDACCHDSVVKKRGQNRATCN